MKPIIVTCTYRQAQELARWLELPPSSWTFGSRVMLDHVLRGQREALVLYTDCSHDSPHIANILVHDQFRLSLHRVIYLPSTYQYMSQDYVPLILTSVEKQGIQLTVEERQHLELIVFKLLNQVPS